MNYLLQRLEQYSGVAVLTTNKEAALDEALQRRLTLHLHLEIPEPPSAKAVAFVHAQQAAALEEHRLPRPGGGVRDVGRLHQNVALRAAFLAAAENSPSTSPSSAAPLPWNWKIRASWSPTACGATPPPTSS